MRNMGDFEEIIVLLREGLEYSGVSSDITFEIPGLTNDLKRLVLKELKIGVNVADVGSDLSWITIKILSPGGGVTPSSGTDLVTVPAVEAGGSVLYRQYHHDNLVLLKLNAQKATQTSRPIKIRINKADGSKLAKDYVYLRMGLFEAKDFAPYMVPLNVARFQAH